MVPIMDYKGLYSQTSLLRCSKGAINFAGLRRLLDYQVTSVIRHCTISRIMSDYAVITGKTAHGLLKVFNIRICKNYT